MVSNNCLDQRQDSDAMIWSHSKYHLDVVILSNDQTNGSWQVSNSGSVPIPKLENFVSIFEPTSIILKATKYWLLFSENKSYW